MTDYTISRHPTSLSIVVITLLTHTYAYLFGRLTTRCRGYTVDGKSNDGQDNSSRAERNVRKKGLVIKSSRIVAGLLAILVISALLAGCRGDNTQKELTHIVASIVANPYSYEGQRVTVVGYYRGWDLLHEAGTGPPVTKSDWVIKDTSGAIYVSARSRAEGSGLGSLDPASLNDVDTILKLVGLVHVSAEGQPYIEAESIEIQP